MAFSIKNRGLYNALHKTAKVAGSETMNQHGAARTDRLMEKDHLWQLHSTQDSGATTQENDNFLNTAPNWSQLLSVPRLLEETVKPGLPNKAALDWFSVNGSGR